MQRKLLSAQKAAAEADAAYRAVIREALDDTGSTRTVADVLGISHAKVQRLTKPPSE
jgi:transcriptional regulator with PAS, ATPase and Fis domain